MVDISTMTEHIPCKQTFQRYKDRVKLGPDFSEKCFENILWNLDLK